MRRTTSEQRDIRAIADALHERDAREPSDLDSATARPLPGVVVLAFALWIGCAIGTSRADEALRASALGLLAVASVGVLAILRHFAIRRARRPVSTPLALAAIATALLGAGWSILRVEGDRLLVERIAQACDGERTVVDLEGTVASAPRGRANGDRLHAFFRQPQLASFELDVDSIGPVDAAWRHAIAGRAIVRLREGAVPWRVGDRVAVTGTFLPDRPAANPGGRTAALATLAPTSLGMVDVPDPRLIGAMPPDMGLAARAMRALQRLRADWQQHTRALLDRMLAGDSRAASRDLLRALLLGDRRGESYADLREDFAAAGLAHFLAISGFNLAVVAGVAALAARAIGVRPRRRGLVVIAAIALYLVALPAQLPVLRAGLSATLLALGLAFARRWDGRAATAVAAIVLLAIAPGEATRPGFQLSFAAVFSLQELAPRLRRRWFGEPDRLGASTRSILASRGADAIAACVAAWAVSTPIALHHFGMAALLGVPATLLATPIVAATVSFAALAMPLGAIVPGTAAASGFIISSLGSVLLAIADSIAAVPHGSWRPAPPGPAATLLVLLAVFAWLVAARRHASLFACALVGAILAVGMPSAAQARSIETTFLAVGDGTAIVVRRGASAALLDVGSVGDRHAGGTTVIRALEALSVRRLDAVFTSHPNLDHYSGLVEVLARHREARWFVGEAFIGAARRSPDGPESAALRWAARLGRVPCVVAAGDAIESAGLVFRCLHPEAGAVFASANDASLVLRVDASNALEPMRPPRPILVSTGDLEAAGLAEAGDAITALEPWISEVPHHGSATLETARLLHATPRTIWVQSTGRRRLEPDSLGMMLTRTAEGDTPTPIRLITARDGAISARFDLDGGEVRLAVLERHAGRWRTVSVPAR